MDISDSSVLGCPIGIAILADEANLENCSITGLAREDFPSFGIVTMAAVANILNCDISDCYGGEAIYTLQGGFGDTVVEIPGMGILNMFSDVNVTGCTISNNDIGVCAVFEDIFQLEQVSTFHNFAGDNFNPGVVLEDGFNSSLIAKLNNIAGNNYCGLLSITDETVDAVNNWWGSVDGPEWISLNVTGQGNMGGVSDTGDVVVGDVDYEPWLGAPLHLPEAYHVSLDVGEQVINASEEADTIIILTTTRDTEISVAAYQSQPFPCEEFPDEALGKYIDIYISDPESVDWPIYVKVSYADAELLAAGIDESSLGLYYY